VKALRPDVVVFLGDMFEGHEEMPQHVPGLCELPAQLGKWYVTGNHDRRTPAGHDLLEGAGFHRLDDAWEEAAPGLVIAGVRHAGRRRRRELVADPIDLALEGRPTGATVLLSHAPSQASRAASAGVELMLSGHTHGGQIWPFGHPVRTVYPVLAGRHDVDGTPIIVCRGTGTWGPPMRLWHRSEILRVTLRARSGPAAGGM
jgi:predicted MPP superfamily phosphohydrolase